MTANPLLPVRTGPDGALDGIVDEVTALAPQRRSVDPQIVAAAARAWSPNAIRAFLSDLRLWDIWCRRSQVQSGAATAQTIAGYVRALSGQDVSTEAERATDARSAATIARYLVDIGWAYRMAGREDPTAAPLVRLELKAARKAVGMRQTQARAIRFKGDVKDLDGPAAGVSLTALIEACRKDMLGARDEALRRVAYDTGCRRSELVAIDDQHIDGPDGEGAGTLLIPKSKTDREGQGAHAYLSPATMRAIDSWRDKGVISKGPLFRRVETYFEGSVRSVGQGALHPGTIGIIYKRLVRQAVEKKLLGAMGEKKVERWVAAVSSHSIRVGVAQDNFAGGESLPAIMQAYRWLDPNTVMRYKAKFSEKKRLQRQIGQAVRG